MRKDGSVIRVAPALRGKSEAELVRMIKHGLARVDGRTVVPTIVGATAVQNSLEGGTNGTEVSIANSGGASGNAFDIAEHTGAATHGTDYFMRYSNATAAHGGLALELANRSVAQAVRFGWEASVGNRSEDYGRFYFRTDTTTHSNTAAIAIFFDSGGVQQCQINITTGRIFTCTDQVGAATTNGTNALSINTWYRVEWHVDTGTGGELAIRVYTGDTAHPTTFDTVTRPLSGAATDVRRVRFGLAGSTFTNWPSTTGFVYFDDLMAGQATWPGPYSAGGTAKAGAGIIGP